MFPDNAADEGADPASAKTKSYPLLIHMPAQLMQDVDELCEQNNMNRSEFIKIALNLYLEKFEGQYLADLSASAASDEEEPGLLAAAEDEWIL